MIIEMLVLSLAAVAAASAQTPTPPPPPAAASPSPLPSPPGWPSPSAVTAARAVPECAPLLQVIDRMQDLIKYWPNFERYRSANAALASPPPGQKRVVFLGDSITDQWDDPAWSSGFFPGQPYLNRGINGQTSAQMLARFRPDVIRLQPEAVVILAGTNDIASIFPEPALPVIRDNLTSMVELARANGIRVVLASLLPVHDYSKRPDGTVRLQVPRRPTASLLAINAWIKAYAEESGAVYLDYYSAMVDERGWLKADLSDDGIHPNAKGYEVMTPLAARAVAAALSSKAPAPLRP
jgi:lysophospholipase L1-like esterase